MVFKFLDKIFYEDDTTLVSRLLLGKLILRNIENRTTYNIILETESYKHDDPASHVFKGKTDRNKSMFLDPPKLYVYKIYGIHHCINFVARNIDDLAGGVLIRSILQFYDINTLNRVYNLSLNHEFKDLIKMLDYSEYKFVVGPGNVSKALNIDIKFDGKDLLDNYFIKVAHFIDFKEEDILSTPRIGISKAKDRLLRFVINGLVYKYR